MENDHLGKALAIAVWLAFALIALGLIGGAILEYPAAVRPAAFVRQGMLHPAPTWPEIGSPRPTERAF
ncbi:hypothetical protein [Acidiferrobacter sp.]|uniref:hypothetical protein n=1 Tax=Acidiferrobacter sp. TaxID=1872107 RepID=UPI00261BACF1|nr:hypothetical protein [Acidiferrobacter sp.]